MAIADPATHAPALGIQDAAQLLYDEAEQLDAREYRSWLRLFAPDATYRVVAGGGPDPRRDLALVHETTDELTRRVERLLSGRQYSQEPPSRTCHQISNVRLPVMDDGAATVTSKLVLFECRLGQDRWYAGRCRHVFVSTTTGWLIQHKHVDLIHADRFLGSLTFGL